MQVALPGGGTLTTRGYNGAVPGPLLRVSPGDRVHVTLRNGLCPGTPRFAKNVVAMLEIKRKKKEGENKKRKEEKKEEKRERYCLQNRKRS